MAKCHYLFRDPYRSVGNRKNLPTQHQQIKDADGNVVMESRKRGEHPPFRFTQTEQAQVVTEVPAE
jgi:hypothetical protein